VVSQPFKGQTLSKLIDIWSQIDPVGALAFVEKNPDTPGTDLTKLLQHWGGMDPEAALAWLARNPILPKEAAAPENAIALYDSLFSGWLIRDALPAANYVAEHLDLPEIRSSLGRATYSVHYYRPESFDSWMKSLPNEETRIEAIKGASDFDAHTAPAADAQWVASRPLEEQGDALILPLTLWLEKDSEAAVKWINDLPTSIRDGAIQIACSDTRLDRQKRLQLAEFVANHETRVLALSVLLHEWFSEEPANAETWLQESSLSNEDKAGLLESEKAFKAAEEDYRPGEGKKK
jgi:hypothetical protein